MTGRQQLQLTQQLSIAAACLLLTACANHEPQYQELESRIEKTPLETQLQIDPGDPMLDLPQRRIRFMEQKEVKVTQVETTHYYDRYTPYQAWREFYEIPLGALNLLVGIGANVLDFLSFGNLPERMTQGWIETGLAGLNPFMNITSTERSIDQLVETQEQRQKNHLEASNIPWANKSVVVSLGAHQYPMTTDRNGILRLNLLEAPFNAHSFQELDKIHISAQDPEQPLFAETDLLISPNLCAHLQEARDLILNDLESEDLNHWVFRINRLNALSLEEEAQDLEKNLLELTQNDPELHQELLHALNKQP